MPSPPKLDVAIEVAAASKALKPALTRLTKALPKLAPEEYPIGALADTLYELRQLNKVLSTVTAPFDDVIGPAIKAAEEYFIQKLAVGESSGVQGKKSRVQITDSVVPVVDTEHDGWAKFYAYIKKTGEFELLNRAPNRVAIVERWDQKKQVPGITKFVSKKVSCTKLSGK